MSSPPSSPPTSSPPPLTLNILTLNCWGLKYISSHRSERLLAISQRLASASPPWDIVALQECWVHADYLALRAATAHVLPYGKFYHSGVLGGGLVILSRWRVVESSMWGYGLNGRPTAFWRGDWYVGKGVAGAVVEVDEGGWSGSGAGSGQGGKGRKRRVEVFCTHLHAPYEKGEDSYLCHRTAQAWQLSKLLRASVQRGHIPVALGDFNMLPTSLAHHIITTHGLVSDAWLTLHPLTPPTPHPTSSATANLTTHGTTCDSILNTWRLPPSTLDIPSPTSPDPHAQRLDYIFHPPHTSRVSSIRVGFTEPHQLRGRHKLGKGVTRGGMVSLSDHFSVEVTLEIPPREPPQLISFGEGEGDGEHAGVGGSAGKEEFLAPEIIGEIQALTAAYMRREKWEYLWRIAHFWASLAALAGLHVGVWWAAAAGGPGVALGCTVLSWVVGVTGVLDGLIGFLFMGSEINALREFEEEIAVYRAVMEEKVACGEGRVRVLGGVGGGGGQGGGASEQMVREEERLEREAVDRGRVGMQ